MAPSATYYEPDVQNINHKRNAFSTAYDEKHDQPSIRVARINTPDDTRPNSTHVRRPQEKASRRPIDIDKIIAGDIPHTRRRAPRISLPVEMMQDSYDVVVIGSGYGGGVAASRMARGKQSVCVLERGQEKWPGEYPESVLDTMKEIRVSGEFAPGDRRGIAGSLVDGGNATGMFHIAVGEGQNAITGNGLGGTSLINANVFLEATPEILEMDVWPEELRGASKWQKYYQRAADVLEPVEYPKTHPEIPKATVLEKQARALGLEDRFYRVKQTTRFHDGPNSTGVPMRASTLTGMDATGVNDGSKSTTLVNYLSDAWNWGAEIFCGCEVRYITKAPAGREAGGYIVHFAWHTAHRSQFGTTFYEDLMWVHAKKLVFLGAGSLGSTEILLRSRQLGLDVSDLVGSEMSGNGNMLGFGYNTKMEANCLATPAPTKGGKPVGPCITSVLDLRDQANPLDGFLVEDCAVPYALGGIMNVLNALYYSKNPVYNTAMGALKLAAGMASRVIGMPLSSSSATDKTAVYLVTSHDSSQGHLELKDDKPVLTYSGVGRSKSVTRIHKFLEKMTEAVGGTFIANPAWTLLGSQEVTAHPIGGAGMSTDGTGAGGVTNHMGEAFKRNSADVHDGLVVCDSAILPGAIGVNPFATIAALAERSVELVAHKYGIRIDYETKNGLLDLFSGAAAPARPLPRDKSRRTLAARVTKAGSSGSAGMEFSEVMTGFVAARSDIEDFQVATKYARSCSHSARLFVSIKSWDTTDLVNDASHSANITGTFSWAASDGGIFVIQRGTFQLFSNDPHRSETTNLTYRCRLVSTSGRVLHLDGYKVVHAGAFLNPLEVWRQTSTLFVTITDPDDGGVVVGRGTLNIHVGDFIQELQTFRSSGPTAWSKLTSAASFFAYFGLQLANPFLSTLGQLQWPRAEGPAKASDFVNPTLPSETITVKASDGVETTMLMWNPSSREDEEEEEEDALPAPVILFVPGASVNHGIFACPTIEHNAVNHFRRRGYRQYCLTFRIGMAPTAKDGWTPYDARQDIRAALAHIRKREAARLGGGRPAPQVYVVAHCVGSLSLSCALLDGTIPAGWIRAITCSQVFFAPKFGRVNQLTSMVPMEVYRMLVGSWWDCSSQPDDGSLIQRVLNQALRLYPVGSAKETCRSVVCHRGELVFGRLWNHENLNEATHSNLDMFFGGAGMQTVGWLTRTGRQGYVATNGPANESLVTPENLARLKGIPILLVSGADNVIYTPENTENTFAMLSSVHGRRWYERAVIPNTGHLDTWMGVNAHKTVYPRVQRHVDKFMKESSEM